MALVPFSQKDLPRHIVQTNLSGVRRQSSWAQTSLGERQYHIGLLLGEDYHVMPDLFLGPEWVPLGGRLPLSFPFRLVLGTTPHQKQMGELHNEGFAVARGVFW